MSTRDDVDGVAGDVIILGGTHIQYHNHFAQGRQPFDQVLDRVATGALYDTAEIQEPARCHPGTRETILQRLANRVANYGRNDSMPFVWIHGAAGAGKSAIMRSTAERLHQSQQLLASFFFFESSNTRNTANAFIPTLIYQLARPCKALRFPIQESIEYDPLIFTRSLKAQIQDLVIGPILQLHEAGRYPTKGPQAIIIDGLDECKSHAERAEVLHALKLLAEKYPTPLCIIVASRPVDDIRLVFESPAFRQYTIDEPLRLDGATSEDICKFLTEKFDEIQATHRMRFYLPLTEGRWPSEKIIWLLVNKASGQFIFATTVIKFVSTPNSNPDQRLQIILGSLPPGQLEPFRELDALYSTIFSMVEEAEIQDVLSILGTFVMSPDVRYNGLLQLRLDLIGKRQCVSPSDAETILGLEKGRCAQLLYPLESLIGVFPETDTVEIFHKSVLEFLLNKNRSGRFHISLERIKACFLKSLIQNDFWYQDPMLRKYMQNGAHIASLLDGPESSPELLDAIKKINFSEMATRILDQPAVIELKFPESWWTSWWMGCHDFVEAMTTSRLPSADELSQHVVSSFRSAIEQRLLFYLQQPDYLWILYLAARPTESELVPFIDNLCSAVPDSIVDLERRQGLGFLFHRWGLTKVQQRVTYHRLMNQEVERLMLKVGMAAGPFSVTMMLGLMIAFAIARTTPCALLNEGPFMETAFHQAGKSSVLSVLLAKFATAFPDELSPKNKALIETHTSTLWGSG